jgi:hypothetical protein
MIISTGNSGGNRLGSRLSRSNRDAGKAFKLLMTTHGGILGKMHSKIPGPECLGEWRDRHSISYRTGSMR